MKNISFSNCGDITEYIKEIPDKNDKYCLMLIVTANEKEELYRMLDRVKKAIEITKYADLK